MKYVDPSGYKECPNKNRDSGFENSKTDGLVQAHHVI